MRRATAWLSAILVSVTVCFPAFADQEASNVAHVASGPHGRCYAKSIPSHVFDPYDQPRQQGRTLLYRVTDGEDALVHEYPWFGQRLFLRCGPADKTIIVRLGPWHRDHDPSKGHLAIAFYRGGELIRRYSTLDIAGGELASDGGFSRYRNVSASVSHYTVFSAPPEMVREIRAEGAVFSEHWFVRAETVDGRILQFDVETGELF